MSFTQSQKKYIKNNRRNKSVATIAQTLHVSEGEVLNYLKNKWGDQKYKKFVSATTASYEKATFISIETFSFVDFVKKNWIVFLFLSILVFIAYLNTFNAAFVSDDNGMMLNVPYYTLGKVFSNPLNFLRPLIYFLTFQIGGYNPFFYRITNIIFHLGSCWTLFVLLSLLSKRWIAILAAALFAIHPILIESVTWISGGVYAQYTFFFLLSFLFYILSSKNISFLYLAIISYLLTLVSSEKSAGLFLVFVFYELLLGDIRKNWKRVGIFIVLSGVFIVAYISSGNVVNRVASLQADSGFQKQAGIDNPLFQIPIALTSYWQLMIFPSGLTIYHSEMFFSFFDYSIRLLITVLYAGLVFVMYKKNRFICFWLCFFIIALLPTLTPFKLNWIVAERYVYLASIGIFVTVSYFIYFLAKIKKMQLYVYTVVTIILIAFMLCTIVRNSDWQNEDNLWIATEKTSPSSQNTHNNMGDVYGRHGDNINAVREFKLAIKIKPDYADAWHNLGNAYVSLGKLQNARKSYEKALFFNPSLWQSHQRLAALDFAEKKFDSAKINIEKALLINPSDLSLQFNYGIVLYSLGDKAKAIAILEEIVRVNPTNEQIKQTLLDMQKNK